ncbi:MAG: DUF58 domain-containing protein [Verrucomicrobiota bacterium]
MMAEERIRKIRSIEITAKKISEGVISGFYTTAFKGRGMDFEEVREYQPGDDVRRIHWDVTARLGTPYVKLFTEERDQTILLVVDVSASGVLGSTEQSKRELAAELACTLALSALQHNDNIGLLLYTDEVEKFIPPKKGRSHIFHLVHQILYFQPKHTNTRLAKALSYLNRIFHHRSIVFILSDFIDEDFETELKLTARRHDVIAVCIDDPREYELPSVGWIALEDAETGETIEINTRDSKSRRAFAELAQERVAERKNLFKKCRIDFLRFMTGAPFLPILKRFFEARACARVFHG